jgi:hypothetical protein
VSETAVVQVDQAMASKFLSLSTISNSHIKDLAIDLGKINEKTNFIPNFVNTNGFVLWGKAEQAKNSNKSLTFLPIKASSKNEIVGFIIANHDEIKNTITYSVFNKRNLLNYKNNERIPNQLNEENVFSLINYFNFNVFGNTRISLPDSNLIPVQFKKEGKSGDSFKNIFGNISVKKSQIRLDSYGGYYCITFSTETDWWWDPDGDDDPCHCSGNETYAYTTVSYQTFCADIYNGGGDGGIPGNPPPTGIGGSASGSGGITYGSRSSNNLDDSGDDDTNPLGGEDTTPFSDFDPQNQSWVTVANVIPKSDFVGWLYPGIDQNCMSYAKAQIAKKGYGISNYFSSETIQIYKSSTGVDQASSHKGVGYLLSALQRGIPVIVGVDDQPGSSSPLTDQTTDHFIVIVGSGSDSGGNYFRFYDNASGDPDQGASDSNKLYYNSSTGKITGTSATSYASGLTYTVTMIRKSK